MLKLGFAHEEPGIFEEGIELLALQVLFHLFALPFAGTDLRAAFDGVERDDLLALGDGGFVLGLARSA